MLPHDLKEKPILFKDTPGQKKKEICPITGLQIVKHPDWQMRDPDGPYEEQFSLIGGRIIFSSPSGFASSEITKKSLQLNAKVEKELLEKESSYVQVEDLSNLGGFTLNARLAYIRHFQEREGLCALVFMGVSYLTSLSIKIGAKLYAAEKTVKVVGSYEEAIQISLDLLKEKDSDQSREPDDPKKKFSQSPPPLHALMDQKTLDDYRIDILRYLGTINLDVEAPGYENVEFSKDHPFSSVFETIDLINHDLNQLITERKEDAKNKIELERRLAQAQKMEALGSLAGGIAHDFNNILSGIIGYCQLAKMNISNHEKAEEQIHRIQKGAVRAADLVKQILIFSRDTTYEKQPLQLGPVIREVLVLLKSSLPATIQIEDDISSESFVMADTAKIHQIVMNLCTNAGQAMDEDGGKMRISLKDMIVVEGSDMEPGKYVKFEVHDTGCGIDESIIDRIFEPYFTTKKLGKGTGMGLSLVYAIVKEHRGHIDVRSRVNKGSVFIIYLPATSGKSIETGSEKSADLLPVGNERIMVVDDEISILESTKELLLDYGYHVEGFADGKAALIAFDENPGGFDLVITDMTMPGLTGDALAKHMLEVRNDLPIILCTGFNEKMSEERALEMGIRRFIEKPIVDQPVVDIVRDVLDSEKG